MKNHLCIILFLTTLGSLNCLASDFYVSTTATGTGDGSFTNPWQLQQALNSPAAITNPTDTVWIWLRGGTYTNAFDPQSSFSCFTHGTANAPIIFRNYVNERATIDGQLPYSMAFVLGKCSYTWLWGLEIMNSSTDDRDHSNTDRGGNVYCTAPNIKFINLIVHDMGSGLDTWKTSSNSETYGCIIYNIGNNLNNNGNWEGHGHGMYLQNDTIGIKKIHNNIIFSTYGYGMKVWQTTNTDALGNFDIQRNIVFNGGAASENLGGVGNNTRTHNFFVVSNGANNPIRNSVIKHNYTYSGINTPRPPVNAFGLNFGVENLILDSNYITCQTRLGFNNTPVFNASVKGNKIIAGIPAVYGYYLWGFTNTDFPENTFLPEEPTSGLEYFVLPNKYEQERAHIAIYNWAGADEVQIDISGSGLQAGDIYELVNVMDYYGDIITDTLDGSGMITVPMTGHSYAPVIGSTKAPVSQFPVFGAFVIRKIDRTVISGIGASRLEQPLQIFPNPAGSWCQVRFSIEIPGHYDILITNLSGYSTRIKNKLYFDAGPQEIQLDLSAFQNGTYLVQVANKQFCLSGKLVLIK